MDATTETATEIPSSLFELQLRGEQAPRFTIAGYQGWAYCSNVYDGDTCQLSFAPRGLDSPARWTCRLARIETAEIGRRAKTPREQEAAVRGRNALRGFIYQKIIYLKVTSMGKYKRPIVELYDRKSKNNINDMMVECGAAVAYGTRPLPWYVSE